MSADQLRKAAVLAAIWAALLLAPYWMIPLGGYTALATRVLVLGLAAMSVNFLLGFTGVLSFGHAAWFGLGAYGAGLTLKFLAPSTPLSLLMGMLLGGVCGDADVHVGPNRGQSVAGWGGLYRGQHDADELPPPHQRHRPHDLEANVLGHPHPDDRWVHARRRAGRGARA